MAHAKLVSMREGGIEVPYDTPRESGLGVVNEDIPEVFSKGGVGRAINSS